VNKLIQDGKVAVIYSPGFGGGWSTWNFSHLDCVFDREIAEQVLDGEDPQAIERLAQAKWGQGDNYFFSGAAEELAVAWLPEGVRFVIREYDGNETIETENDIEWLTA